jgi:hypothetical protein
MKSTTIAVTLLTLLVLLSLPASAALTIVTSSPETIVKADTVTFMGTGAQNGSVTLWIIGRNYFATIPAKTDKSGNFTFVIKPEQSTGFSTGYYAFLIQDPGADKSFEINPVVWSDGSIRIADQGKVITNLGQISSFPADIGPVAGTILNASVRPDVDDIFTPYYFEVQEPEVHFNRVSESDPNKLPDQTTGEAILITGTTNVGPEDHLLVEIRNATSNDLVTSQNIPVENGTTTNQWTYSLDEPGLHAGSYTVTVGEQKYTASGDASKQLTILQYFIPDNSSLLSQPELPPGETIFGAILPLFICFAALAIIGIIILGSSRK